MRRRAVLKWRDIKPAKFNDEMYGGVDLNSDGLRRLADQIAANGLDDDIHVTRDHVIISGHRRFFAILLANGGADDLEVPVIIREDIEAYSDSHNARLVGANSQRVKTIDELVREAVFLSDPADSYEKFKAEREKAEKGTSLFSATNTIDWEARKSDRSQIKYKQEMLQAAIKVIEDNREYWPLSVRQVHYRMLPVAPMRSTYKNAKRYVNDEDSYNDLSNLLTRARVLGQVSWDAIADETRETVRRREFSSISPFVEAEINQLFGGYRRNLLQDQDAFFLLMAEKLTVKNILSDVCARFCLPMVICRGYPDIGTPKDIADRFILSGKNKLVLLFVNDFDPEGWNIPQTICQQLSEDFAIDPDCIDARRVAMNKDYAVEMGLPCNPAKETSARFKTFVKETGSAESWEIEAVDPGTLIDMVKEAIEEAIDIDRFNAQMELEQSESSRLLAMAEAVKRQFSNIRTSPNVDSSPGMNGQSNV